MKVTVRYFAVLRDQAGVGEEQIETDSVSARQLINELIITRNLSLPSPLIRPAVDNKFVEDDYPMTDGCTIVLIPPVAGG